MCLQYLQRTSRDDITRDERYIKKGIKLDFLCMKMKLFKNTYMQNFNAEGQQELYIFTENSANCTLTICL